MKHSLFYLLAYKSYNLLANSLVLYVSGHVLLTRPNINHRVEFNDSSLPNFAESKLIKAINEEIPMMIMYWLNNRHPNYYMKRAPHPPSYIERLEADLIEKHEKAEQLIRAFTDDPKNLPSDTDSKE